MSDEAKTAGETLSAEAIQWRTKAQEHEAKVADYEKRFKGINPEEYHANKQAITDLMKERANKGDDKAKEEYEKHLKDDYEKRYSGKFTDLEKERDDYKGRVTKYEVIVPAMAELAKHINADQMEIFQGLIEANCMSYEGQVVVRGQDGKPRPSAKDPRSPITPLAEFIDELKGKYPSSFQAEQTPGGRTQGTTSRANGQTSKVLDYSDLKKMSAEEMRKNPDAVRAAVGG